MSRWYWLLIVPFVALLAPVYLKTEPALGGFPFFYWYQFAVLILSAVLTWIVYRATRETPQ
jgi:hypothetical protein